MTQRINLLEYTLDSPGYPHNSTNLFFDGPGEFLVKSICKLLSEDPLWPKFFGERIDPYLRMDYSIRELPALRIYTMGDEKSGESWFINGEVKADVIFPASIRRNETQQLQNTLATALLQQFRRPLFFQACDALVPGLNELGKTFKSEKGLGFKWNEDYVPLTQLTLNYRIDLRQWDDYLEETDRTKDSPFSPVLKDLRRIVSDIQALRDDGTEEVKTEIDQIIPPGTPTGPKIF